MSQGWVLDRRSAKKSKDLTVYSAGATRVNFIHAI